MEFLMKIDWLTVSVTLAVVIIVFNTFQIIRYALVKRKAEEEMKKLEERAAKLNQELESAKKELSEYLKSLQK